MSLTLNSFCIARRNTTRVVLQRCTEILYQNQGDEQEFEPFSQSYHRRNSKLLGHVLRCRDDDPMRQVSFQPSSAIRVQYGKKRAGRPRQNWLHDYAKQHVFEHVLRGYNYNETVVEDTQVYTAAITRTF